MRTIAPGTGSIADQLNAVAIVVRECADIRALEYRWSRIMRSLEAIADRATSVRRRGGSPVGIAGPVAWLESTVRASTGLSERLRRHGHRCQSSALANWNEPSRRTRREYPAGLSGRLV